MAAKNPRKTGDRRPGARKRLPASERRDQILAAAQKVFVRAGLSGARTKEVALEAGVNEATLFRHFDSKEALFDAAILEPLRTVVQRQLEISREYAAAEDPASMREIGRTANAQMLEMMQETYPLLATALFSDSKMGAEFYRDHVRPVLEKSADAAREALLVKVARFDPELIALAAFGVYFIIVADAAFRDVPLDAERTVDSVTDLLMSGFLKGGGG